MTLVPRMQGTPLPSDILAPYRDSTPVAHDAPALQARLADDGYVFLRGAVPRATALAGREEALGRLVEVGEIAPPASAGIFTGASRRKELHPDLGAFWKSVSDGPRLRAATHGPELQALVSRILGTDALAHDYLFLRIGTVGKSTRLHNDAPFFSRGSKRVLTVWLALGDVPLSEGPLVVLEGSQQFTDLVAKSDAIDYGSVQSPRVAVTEDAVELARQRGTRLLTNDFAAGDCIIFNMQTMHGSLDNQSPENRVRVSCDIRYQPAADPRDERYFGANPGGTTGAGYGELNGAKPLTEAWHTR